MVERALPTEDKAQLCEVLLRFDTMSDRDSRNLYVNELENTLGQSLSLRRYIDAKHDVWALVNACLNFPGALSAFTQVLRSFHGNSSPMAELERMVNMIEPNLPQPSPVRATLVGLTEMQHHRATAEYHTSPATPDTPAAGDMSIGMDVGALVGRFAAVAGVDDNPLAPLRAAETLAHTSLANRSRELHRWIDDLGDRLGIDEAVLRRICTEARQGARPGAPLEDSATARDRVVPDGDLDGTQGEGEEGMQTAIVVATSTPPAKPADLPRIWGNVPFRNPSFTGRDEHLQHLHDELTTHEKASVLPQTLHGWGGVGKTQLAVEYVYRHGDQYNLVWWISAERPTDALASLAELGERLGVRAGQDRPQAVRAVLGELANSKYRWLLVYDNANRPEDIAEWVPTAGGHVILTSRNADWTRRWPAIEVDVFERDESIELLRKRGTSISDEVADQLAEKLGDLPLALEQAANFQVATGMPIKEYLELFDQRLRELLNEGRPADYPATVVAFLRLAFDNLRDATPAAAELLDLFAFLGPDPISAGLLHGGRRAELSSLLARSLRDTLQMNRMIRDLTRYGLAKVDPKGQKIQVHRLVQSVLRTELDDDRSARTLENVRNLLAEASPTHPDEPETWRTHSELGPHLHPANMINSTNPEARLVVIDQARYLFVIGDYAASRDLARKMVDTWSRPDSEGGLGHDHEQTILAMRHLASALRALGKYQEARELGEKAFQLLRANPQFGDDHEHTVHVAFGFGFDLGMAGDLAGALRRDEENLRRATRVYGAEHDYTLRAKGNVAVAYRMLGRFQDAHDLSASIVHDHEEMFGDTDARTLLHVMNLTCDLHGLGRYREALQTQLRVWKQTVENLAEHQRERLLADRNIAIALRKTGDHLGGLARAEANHKAFDTFFGNDHEYTLAAGTSHANALRAAGRLVEARDTAAAMVAGYREKFGDRHRLTLVAQVNFGIVLRLLGERRVALELQREAYETLTDVLGAEHPYTLSAACDYANSLVAGPHADLGRQLTAQTLEISRRVRGPEHPDTLACAVNAALDLQEMAEAPAEQQAAQHQFDEVIDLLERVMGLEHPETVDAIRGKRADCDIEPPPT